jgi:hypothetical protein
MKNVWDWVKQINSIKSDSSSFSNKDWEIWNSYMVHRIISMNPDFIEVVNQAQTILPQNKEQIYLFYKEYIPKNNKWSKYVKSSIKQPNTDLVNHIKDYFQCSSKEAKEYITLLDTTNISRILTDRGIETKELKQLLK